MEKDITQNNETKPLITKSNTTRRKVNLSKEGDLYQQLKDRKNKLEALVIQKEKAIDTAPEGTLKILKRKNYFECYQRTDESDTNGKYLSKDKREIAQKLAQKHYDSKIVAMAKKEIVITDKYLDFLADHRLDEIYLKLSDPRRSLVQPIEWPDKEFVQMWKDVKYEPMGFDPEDPEFYSDMGVRVRSKSEILIANMLEKNNIPYRYEYPVSLKRHGIVRPDFLCLNVRTRKCYYWEHFGMMDSPSYANKNVDKLNDYEESGYHLGVNFLATFETYAYPLKQSIIDQTIKQYLL